MIYLELYNKLLNNKLTRTHRFDLLCKTFNDWKKAQDFDNINNFLTSPIFDDLSFNIGVLTYSIGINSPERKLYYDRVYEQAVKIRGSVYVVQLFKGLEPDKSENYYVV